MARFGTDPIWGRLIHQPQIHKGFAELVVSSREGIVRPRVFKRERERYREVSDYRWGAALPSPVEPTPPTSK
jgi:hypothetical protein